MPTYKLTDGRHGRFLYNGNDSFIGRSLETYGEWSDAEVRLFAQLLRPGDLVVEAGSNIGTHTVPVSRLVGDAGRVIAFEAARATHQLLCANLALNECFNVQAERKAVGPAHGTMRFPVIDPRREFNFGAASPFLLLTMDLPWEDVEMVAIDDLGLERLDFIKSDIEGGEPDLVRGAARTIERTRPVLYLEITAREGARPTGNRDELVDLLESAGYEAYYYLAPMFLPDNVRGNTQDVFHATSIDLLCVPPEKIRVEGLTRARVGDDALRIDPARSSMWFLVEPWTSARITRT